MDEFEELLKSLAAVAEGSDTLAKAMPTAGTKKPAPDDKAVAAAAAESGVGGNPDGEDNDPDYDDEDDEMGKDGKPEFGKSFGTDASGNDLVDATELVKSLMARQSNTDGVLAKALTSMTGTLAKQNDLIKSLQDEVKSLGSQGRGRKTLVTVAEKPGIADTLAKSAAADGANTITASELLAKSQAAYASGKLSGVELNTVDVCLRSGWPIDTSILHKVAAA